MAEFLLNSDAFVWAVGDDARLRSPIVTLIVLDRSPDWPELVRRFDRLSRTVPVFRQKIVPSPLTAPPRWEADSNFDIDYHLRRLRAPEPGSMDSLLELARVAVMADFDRDRPLWEVTLIDGLRDGGAAVLCKLHHAITDGVGAVAMASELFDLTPEGDRQAPMPSPPAIFAPRPFAAVRDAASYEMGFVEHLLTGGLRAAPGVIAHGLLHPRRTIADAAATISSVVRTARPSTGPRSPIMRRRTTGRRLAVHEVSKADLQKAGHRAGGSLNDAFLAAVAGGLRLYHQKHNATVDNILVTMPISIRAARDPAVGNRTTLMRFDVPADIVDPACRIEAIHKLTDRVRHEKSLRYTQYLAGAMNLAPRWYVGSVLSKVDFLASDVPGLPVPVMLGGARVVMQYAFPPTLGASFNITLLSYVDTCALGINADTGAVADFEVFYGCLVAGFDEVVKFGSEQRTGPAEGPAQSQMPTRLP